MSLHGEKNQEYIDGGNIKEGRIVMKDVKTKSIDYKLVEYDIHKLKNMKYRRSSKNHTNRNVIGIIAKFVDLNYDCCELCICDDRKTAHIEHTIVRRSVKLGGYDARVRVVLRGNKIFLVNKHKWDNMKGEKTNV